MIGLAMLFSVLISVYFLLFIASEIGRKVVGFLLMLIFANVAVPFMRAYSLWFKNRANRSESMDCWIDDHISKIDEFIK